VRRTNVERLVDRAELERVVLRLLRRCRPQGECLVLPGAPVVPQARARIAFRQYVLLSGPRAVMAANGSFPSALEHVRRTCGEIRCLALEHLVAVARDMAHQPAVWPRTIAAMRVAGRDRRSYTERQAALLRRMVGRGWAVEAAAIRVGVHHGTAHNILRDGARRGARESPRCSRCGTMGHYRNRGCPQAGNP
jgi:hypothetical protein